MKLQESGEMYLETILILSNKSPHVRSLDVAEYMGFSKPSVSRAVGLLKKGGFITVSTEGFLQLTEEGMAVAVKIYERHVMISDFLERIGVDRETAVDDACKIEHDISETSFEALKKHIYTLNG
ncbi:MAG: metal-dependent transcriptional regulator [Clostridia bacterium]|nr:metal-dependent transcriptional regulator [Clostridia bacterium]